MLDALTRALTDNPALQRRNRFARLSIVVRSGAEAWTVRTGGARIAVTPGATVPADLELSAAPAAWAAFREPLPPVGYQSLNGMMRMGHLAVSGKMIEFGRHLTLLEELFAALRPAETREAPKPVGKPFIEAVTGRYLHLDIEGRPHRVYFEEAGPADGIPLVCLHTAGSDGRQYRAVLNDPSVTRRYRVIAFDLPWHGKSSPRAGYERETYKLTTDLYVATVLAVADALGLARPVVMGCSIGGRAVLHLALRHGNRFRAAIGLQSALYADPGANPALRQLEVIHRPDVHGGDVSAAFVACLVAPASPKADRWETLWHYMQGGPGVFLGDLNYYMADGDMRNLDLSPLQRGTCPVHLLTGEYDLSATPELTADLARRIGAASFEVMRGMGHFPMSESPEAFLGYLRPVLETIAGDR